MAKLAGQRCKSQHGRLRESRAAQLAVWWHLLCRDCYRPNRSKPPRIQAHAFPRPKQQSHTPSTLICSLWGRYIQRRAPMMLYWHSVVLYFSIKAIFLNCENILAHGIRHSHDLLVTELELINNYSVGTTELGQNVDTQYVGSTNPDKIIQPFLPSQPWYKRTQNWPQIRLKFPSTRFLMNFISLKISNTVLNIYHLKMPTN